MNDTPNIYLIGYRCTGKSSIGKKLAHLLGLKFLDTDALVQLEAGQTVSEIVAEFGWEHFRSLEKKVLLATDSPVRQVISTGGGIILDPDNRAFLKSRGFCIWLTAQISTIVQRLEKDKNTGDFRPALSRMSIMEETKSILLQRMPLYDETHHMRLETDHIGVDECARQIYRRISNDGL